VRIVIEKVTLGSALRAGQWALGASAVLLLSYCALILAEGWLFQRGERAQLEQLRHDRAETSGSVIPAPAAAGGLIGRMEIPRLGLSVMVVEGVGTRALRRAAGHIPGTALPGQPGNVGISAHRDTFFRPLRKIQKNDVITFTTALGDYRYRVRSTKVVRPRDVEVLHAGGTEILTLVTCYPFYFVGPAPSRFIVQAERTL
jgi:sortase A